MKVTAQLYGQFWVSSQVNYTGTYLADHLDGLTHDNVRYFLKTQRFTPRQLWQQVRPEVVFSARGYVLFDDTFCSTTRCPTSTTAGAPNRSAASTAATPTA